MMGKAMGASARLLAAAYFALLLAMPLLAQAFQPADFDALAAALVACCDAETSGSCTLGDTLTDWKDWTGAGCVNGTDALADWDTSRITDMNNTFHNAWRFNGDVSGWDVSSVTSMYEMFYDARDFNRDLSDWDVSSVTNMISMFEDAYNFNSDLSDWDVSSVVDMKYMFKEAYHFNGDVSDWDVSSVTNMHGLFDMAYAFDGDLSDWDVSSVTSMYEMFDEAMAFTGRGGLSNWDVSSVTSMYSMFYEAYSFKGCDLSGWDVSSVMDFEYFMSYATAFDGNVSGWNMARSLADAESSMFDEMFTYAYNFRGIGLENWTFNSSWTSYDFDNKGLYDMFVDRKGVIIGDVTNWPYADSFTNDVNQPRFSPSAYNCSDSTNVTTCTMNGCDAAEMTRHKIPHGSLGDCGDADLDHKDECTPECDAGYEASGHMVCYGSFAINSFECKPIETCSGADTAPADGSAGDCTASLAQGEICTPDCDEGFTGYGHRLCHMGDVIDVFTCVADPETCSGADTAPADGSAGNCTASLAQGEFCTPACNSGYTGHGGRICSLGSVIDFFECVQDAEHCDIETPSGGSPTDMSDSDDESVLPGSSKGSSAPLGAAVAPAVLGWVALAAFLPAF